MKKVILLAGPTAVGKTEISLTLAEQLKGEILCADSMQIYKDLNIGTAKPLKNETERCPHHLFDFIEPEDAYSVSDYKRDASLIIAKLLEKDVQPIVTGGTGLYFNALMYQMDFSKQEPNQAFREELTQYAAVNGRQMLHDRLRLLNPQKAEEIHPNNIQRVIRAIEIATFNTDPQKSFAGVDQKNEAFDFTLIILDRDRDELYDRINKRVDIMVEAGLFQEVELLIKKGLTAQHQSMKGIGYKEVIAYFNGESSYTETIDKIKQSSRHYAKRQLTWFKRYPDAKWFNLSKLDDYNGLIGDIITNI